PPPSPEGEEERVRNKRQITEQTDAFWDRPDLFPFVPLFAFCSVLSSLPHCANSMTLSLRLKIRFRKGVQSYPCCRRSFPDARPCDRAASDKGSSSADADYKRCGGPV